MTESDDPGTLLVLAGIGASVAVSEEQRKSASKSASKQRKRQAAATAEGRRLAEEAANKKTASPLGGLSEQAKKTRRFNASQLTKPFAPPTLATPGLTGA